MEPNFKPQGHHQGYAIYRSLIHAEKPWRAEVPGKPGQWADRKTRKACEKLIDRAIKAMLQ